jgi:hypothetical protein
MAGRAMNEKTKKPIHSVFIKDIDCDDALFRMTFGPFPENLEVSMANAGLTNPVILRGEERFQIVTGYRRVLVARSLGWETIGARVFAPHELAFEDGFKLGFYENLGSRTFNLIEASMVVTGLVRGCKTEENHVRKNALPLLGFQSGRKVYEQLLSLAQLIDAWKQLVVTNGTSLPNAAKVSRFSPGEQKALYDVISDLRLGENKLRQCLEMVEEISARDEIPLHQIFAGEPFAFLSEREQRNSSERTELFRKTIRSLRYPALTREEEQFQALRKKLILPPSASLEPPEFFEGDKLKVTLKFRSSEELRSLLDKLEEAADGETLRALLDML